jgi:UDP-N-acetylglucosamine:LPS N-acetylglucosamine transferase
MDAPRVLILTASIGEGHDLPARFLADGIRAEQPDAQVEIVDFLAIVGPVLRRTIVDGSKFDSEWGNRAFEIEYRLVSDIRPTRWLAGALTAALARRPLLRAIARSRPDVIVSTYPAATEALGRLRVRGRIDVPLASAITDLAALRWWAHPGVDLHLTIHPESTPEVLSIAPRSRVECVRGLTDPAFYEPRGAAGARGALGLPAAGPIIAVSGGGWAVGDLAGAVEEALEVPEAHVVALGGRNAEVRGALERRFGSDPRVTVLGFTKQMPDLLAAADVLVHSTAGLTVLEALMLGCRVVSYGWGRAHIRVNNEAYVRDGLAEVAADRSQLAPALRRSLERPRDPDGSFARLPSAASAVLSLQHR